MKKKICNLLTVFVIMVAVSIRTVYAAETVSMPAQAAGFDLADDPVVAEVYSDPDQI